MKDQKFIKKIQKNHAWPSVLFLIITITIALSAVYILFDFNISQLIEERVNTERIRTEYIINKFENTAGKEKEIMDKIIADHEIDNSFFIYDKDKKLIAGSGEMTFNETIISDFMDEDMNWTVPYVVYCDNTDDNIIDSKGNLKLSNVLDNFYKLYDPDMLDNTDNTLTYSYAVVWFRYKLSDGRYIMLKCDVPVYMTDTIRSLGAGLLTLFLFAFPLLLFFINLLISFSDQKKMKKILYTNTVTGGHNLLYYEHKAFDILSNKRGSYMTVDITVMKYNSFCNYHGIHAGEEFLEDIDTYINSFIRRNEIEALSGRSSFVLFLKYSDQKKAQERVKSILDSLTEKFGHEGVNFHAGIYFPEKIKEMLPKEELEKTIDPSDYYNRAGAACASITDENATSIAVYDDMLLEKQLWEHKVAEKMEDALANREFHVYIQPKYDPVTETLSGAEALVRWINDEDGFIPPGKFIPIFEKNGFITKLDDFMIDSISRLQANWLKEGKNIVPVSVNVSRAHFADPDLAAHISEIVDRYDLPHKYIEIELTESAFFDDRDVLLNTVGQLRNLGFEISMDDFGAGYSSLNSLKDLPLDVLKLDADFFRGEDSQERGEIVVAQAITLAKKLNMRIVAEGIEHKEQVDFLAKQGCDMIQGFYFAKPMPAEEYAERMTSKTEENTDKTE